MDNNEIMEEVTMELPPVVENKPVLMIQLLPEELKTLIAEGVKQVVDMLELAEDDPFITPKKAARLLDVTVRTLDNYRELKKYRHPVYKLVRYRKSEVEAFLKKSDFLGNFVAE